MEISQNFVDFSEYIDFTAMNGEICLFLYNVYFLSCGSNNVLVYVVSIFVQLIEMPIDFIMQGRFEDIG